MSIKSGHKQSNAAVLSSVTAEMAKPRLAESAKKPGIKKEQAAAEAQEKRKRVPSSPARGASPIFISPAF
jgi:hypothetical protein